MKYLKTYESYWTEQEYTADISTGLANYNLRPLQINKIISEYEDEILDNRDTGKQPSFFVDKIVKELDLDKGGFTRQRTPPRGAWKQNYYL